MNVQVNVIKHGIDKAPAHRMLKLMS